MLRVINWEERRLSSARKKAPMPLHPKPVLFRIWGYETDKYLGPGEIILMTAEGCEQIKPANDRMQICSFLWVYYGYPASDYENINVESVRYRCGSALAKNDTVGVDFVAGIPDSGIGHAPGGMPRRKASPTAARSSSTRRPGREALCRRPRLPGTSSPE